MRFILNNRAILRLMLPVFMDSCQGGILIPWITILIYLQMLTALVTTLAMELLQPALLQTGIIQAFAVAISCYQKQQHILVAAISISTWVRLISSVHLLISIC